MIILIGATCSGKDSIKKELINLGYESVVTYTTRPMRPGEIDGVTYHFISKEEFLQKKSEGFFAETTFYNVASGETWYYGSAIKDLTANKVIIANPDGVKELKKHMNLNPVVFHITANKETIWNRLMHRGDNVEEAQRRLNADELDFMGINKYVDFKISNNENDDPSSIAALIDLTYSMKDGDED